MERSNKMVNLQRIFDACGGRLNISEESEEWNISHHCHRAHYIELNQERKTELTGGMVACKWINCRINKF